MKTNLIVSAALAVALGFSSWSASAASSYSDASPVASNPPANSADMEIAKTRATGTQTAMYVDKVPGDAVHSTAVRIVSPERANRINVTPARMFQLRDNAGG